VCVQWDDRNEKNKSTPIDFCVIFFYFLDKVFCETRMRIFYCQNDSIVVSTRNSYTQKEEYEWAFGPSILFLWTQQFNPSDFGCCMFIRKINLEQILHFSMLECFETVLGVSLTRFHSRLHIKVLFKICDRAKRLSLCVTLRNISWYRWRPKMTIF